MSIRSAKDLERALSGRAVTAGDGMLHIEAEEGRTMCGEPVESYPLHWNVTTWVACGICLMEAGVPLATERTRECGATSWQQDGYAICRGLWGHDGGHVWEAQ